MSTDQLETAAVEYREIPGFPGYRVGNDGTVWTCRKKVRVSGTRWGFVSRLSDDWRQMKPTVNRLWIYPNICLVSEGKRIKKNVHVLIALAFLGPRPPGQEVRHLNGNRFDCRLLNIAYGTPTQNNADKRLHGTLRCGENHPSRRLTENAVRDIRKRYAAGETARSIASSYSMHEQTIWSIIYRRNWRHVA